MTKIRVLNLSFNISMMKIKHNWLGPFVSPTLSSNIGLEAQPNRSLLCTSEADNNNGGKGDTASPIWHWTRNQRIRLLTMSLSLSSTTLLIPPPVKSKTECTHLPHQLQAISFSPSVFTATAVCVRNEKRYLTSRRRFCCKSQLSLAELAPATSAVYGALLFGGGLFACTLVHGSFELRCCFVLRSTNNSIVVLQFRDREARVRYMVDSLELLLWRR